MSKDSKVNIEDILVPEEDVWGMEELLTKQEEPIKETLFRELMENERFLYKKLIDLKNRYNIDYFAIAMRSTRKIKEQIKVRENDAIVEIYCRGFFYTFVFLSFMDKDSEETMKNRYKDKFGMIYCMVGYINSNNKEESDIIKYLVDSVTQ